MTTTTRTLTAAFRTPMLLLSADLLVGYLAAMLALAAAARRHARTLDARFRSWADDRRTVGGRASFVVVSGPSVGGAAFWCGADAGSVAATMTQVAAVESGCRAGRVGILPAPVVPALPSWLDDAAALTAPAGPATTPATLAENFGAESPAANPVEVIEVETPAPAPKPARKPRAPRKAATPKAMAAAARVTTDATARPAVESVPVPPAAPAPKPARTRKAKAAPAAPKSAERPTMVPGPVALPPNVAALAAVCSAVATKYATTGVLVESAGEGSYRVVATDSKILAVIEGESAAPLADLPDVHAPYGTVTGSAVIPGKAFKAALPKKADRKNPAASATVITPGYNVSAVGSEDVQNVGARFVPWRDVVPVTGRAKTRFVVNAKELADAFRAATKPTDKADEHKVEFVVMPGGVFGVRPVLPGDTGAVTSGRLTHTTGNEYARVRLNGKLVGKLLAAALAVNQEGDDATLSVEVHSSSDIPAVLADRPVVFRAKNGKQTFTGLAMPLA